MQERPCLMFIKLSDDFNRHSCMAPRALRILFVPLADKVCAPPISLPLSLSLSLSLSLCFNGHFPGEPGLAGVYWSKGWWRWWWQLVYWSYKLCKAPVKSSPPTNQHPVFYRPDALPVTQPTVSKHWRGKISHSMDLLTPSSPAGLPTFSLTTNSSWLPWGGLPCLSSALWCQYTTYQLTYNYYILSCICLLH